jgi:hypothetical protein
MEKNWIGTITAIAKRMALRYGVVNITDIGLNAEANGIEFVLATGDVIEMSHLLLLKCLLTEQ